MPLAVVELTPVTVGAMVSMAIDFVAERAGVPEPVARVKTAALGVGHRVEDRAAVERQGGGDAVVELGWLFWPAATV